MIQKETILNCADNSGANKVMCIGILSPKSSSVAYAGSVIRVSVKSAVPNSKVKSGETYKAVIVRTVSSINRGSTSISFDDNSVVLFDKNDSLIGTRIFGPIAREVREVSSEIISLAKEVR